MEYIVALVLAVLGIFGVRKFWKDKSDAKAMDEFKKKDNVYNMNINRVDKDLRNIKKRIAEKKTGKKLGPKEVEEYWKNND